MAALRRRMGVPGKIWHEKPLPPPLLIGLLSRFLLYVSDSHVVTRGWIQRCACEYNWLFLKYVVLLLKTRFSALRRLALRPVAIATLTASRIGTFELGSLLIFPDIPESYSCWSTLRWEFRSNPRRAIFDKICLWACSAYHFMWIIDTILRKQKGFIAVISFPKSTYLFNT